MTRTANTRSETDVSGGGALAPMPGDTVPGWTTDEERVNATLAYEDELVRRYNNHFRLSRFDRADARKIIAARKLAAKATTATPSDAVY